MSDDPNVGTDVHVEHAVEITIRLGLIAVMVVLCYVVVRPFLIPIAWAVIIAIAVAPFYQRLLRLFGGRRAVASVAFTLIALVLLILPIIMLSGTLVEGATILSKGFQHDGWHLPPAPDLTLVPMIGPDIEAFWNEASGNLEAALEKVEPQIKKAGGWILAFATGAGVGLLHFILAIGIAAVLLAKSETSMRVGQAIAWRLAGKRGDELARQASAVVRSVSRGILGVALIQAIMTGLGMLVAGVPAAGLWALLALLLSTIQIGVFPVLLPAVIYVFWAKGTTTAVLFLLWAIVVGFIDNILKPLLLGRGVSVPMLVIFVGAIGGFIGAGIIGLFVGSVVLVLGYELFLAWLKEDPSVSGLVSGSGTIWISRPGSREESDSDAGPGPGAGAGS